jgi:flavin reductase (DIM6/NTAB) family NADH-FMN oxidoreductase RutF
VDEFEMAGLKARPSRRVKPPGIEGCLAWAECVLEEEMAREKFVLIVGKVVHLEADDRFWSDAEGMDFERAKPLCAMGGQKGMQFAYPVSSGRGAKYAAMLAEVMK